MRNVLRRQGYKVNRKRIQRLMRGMGLQSVAPKPVTSMPYPSHKVLSIDGGDGLVQPFCPVLGGICHHGHGVLCIRYSEKDETANAESRAYKSHRNNDLSRHNFELFFTKPWGPHFDLIHRKCPDLDSKLFRLLFTWIREKITEKMLF